MICESNTTISFELDRRVGNINWIPNDLIINAAHPIQVLHGLVNKYVSTNDMLEVNLSQRAKKAMLQYVEEHIDIFASGFILI